ncbi:MAG TPA: flagellar export protein FliJ [Syntrophaceae bacterium]|nr:flagellar export protein FliJ [Syntrophaceae bacterium]
MFKFDMEAVLDYRVQIEEQCQLAFSNAVKCLQSARVVLAELQKERNELIRNFTKIQGKALRADVIQRHFAFIEYLKGNEEEQMTVIRKMEEEANEKRLLLLDAMKKRKVMDTLREKKMVTYLEDMAAKDRKEQDDLAIMKFGNGVK